MNALKAIILAGGLTVILLLGVATFNYNIDPMCFYQCEKVELGKTTLNTYYQVAQKIFAHPKAEIVILGSSRGQTTPPLWIEKETGHQTLNLSMGGAELSAKMAFLNIAIEQTKVKKVLWFADYFELLSELADVKIKSTPALRSYLATDQDHSKLSHILSDIIGLIDHNTLEASFYSLEHSSQSQLDQGTGSGLDFDRCQSENYQGEKSNREMEKEIGFSYDTYSRKILRPEQSKKAWIQFVNKLEFLNSKNIDVVIIIPPYNPIFSSRLANQYPEIFARHRKWIDDLKNLKISRIKVVDYFNSIPNDDGTPRYWNDGVHFTCRGAIEMLKHEI